MCIGISVLCTLNFRFPSLVAVIGSPMMVIMQRLVLVPNYLGITDFQNTNTKRVQNSEPPGRW